MLSVFVCMCVFYLHVHMYYVGVYIQYVSLYVHVYVGVSVTKIAKLDSMSHCAVLSHTCKDWISLPCRHCFLCHICTTVRKSC